MREAYLEGKFVNFSKGRVYYGYSRDNNAVTIAAPKGSKWGVGMDFNVNPMACVVFWYTTDDMHFYQEYELPNADTEYACQHLRGAFGEDLIAVFPDASGKSRGTNAPGGKSDFSILQSHGFRIFAHSANPPRKDRYNATNRMLSPGLGGRCGITINPKGCPKLLSYLDQYTHEHMNAQENMSHLLDAFSYPIAFLHPIIRPKIRLTQNFG